MHKPRSVKAGTYASKSAPRARADRSQQGQAKQVAVSPVHRRKPGYQSRIRRPRDNTRIAVSGSIASGRIASKLGIDL